MQVLKEVYSFLRSSKSPNVGLINLKLIFESSLQVKVSLHQ